MDSPRTAILHAIKGLLGANQGTEEAPAYPTPAGARNEVAYALPVYQQMLPASLIYDDRETADGWLGGQEKRRLELEIEFHALAATAEALDALLDLGAWTVEAAVLADPRLGGLLAKDIEFKELNKGREEKGEHGFYGTAVLSFDAVYLRPALDLSTLKDFLRFYGDYDLTVPDGVIDAADRVQFPPPEE